LLNCSYIKTVGNDSRKNKFLKRCYLAGLRTSKHATHAGVEVNGGYVDAVVDRCREDDKG